MLYFITAYRNNYERPKTQSESQLRSIAEPSSLALRTESREKYLSPDIKRHSNSYSIDSNDEITSKYSISHPDSKLK